MIAKRSEALPRRVLAREPGQIAVSSIVAPELHHGAYRSRKVAFNLETPRVWLADFKVIEFDREDARVTGEIRAELAAEGTPVGPHDTLIAGRAKARGLILIANNVGEFSGVTGLRFRDWTIT